MAGGGIVLQAVEDPPAIEVGQADVEGDGVRPQLAGGGKGIGATRGHHYLEALLVPLLGQDGREGRVVLHHQQHPISGSQERPIVDHGTRARSQARRRPHEVGRGREAGDSAGTTGSRGTYRVKVLPRPGGSPAEALRPADGRSPG